MAKQNSTRPPSSATAQSTTESSNDMSSLSPSSTSNTNTTDARPTFVATDLTGCFAGTGGSTVMTVSSDNANNWIPAPPPSSYGQVATKDEILTVDCTDFMTLPKADHSVNLSFKRNDVCTSYLKWDEQHPYAPQGMGVDPPGVRNMIGPTVWDCCGGCALLLEGVDILYFSTAPTPECSTMPSGITQQASPELVTAAPEFAVVDGSTL
ncbi:MAG: hypothetical protein Q9222_006235 [Ikaeria aurantiellina]